MSDLANLPYETSPADFFAKIQEALSSEPAPADAPADKLQIHLTGDGGGGWAIGFVDGALACTEETVEGCPAQVTLSVADWRELTLGKVRDAVAEKVGGIGGISDNDIKNLFKLTSRSEQIKAFSGDLQLQLENGDDTYKATLTFGGTAPNTESPTTTIAVGLDDFIGITQGEVNPQQAFFMGKIRLDGDMNLAMSLMALAMG